MKEIFTNEQDFFLDYRLFVRTKANGRHSSVISQRKGERYVNAHLGLWRGRRRRVDGWCCHPLFC
jgi:hypothetical protein